MNQYIIPTIPGLDQLLVATGNGQVVRNENLRQAGKTLDHLDFEVGEALDILDFEIRKAVDEPPLAAVIRETGDGLHLEVGEALDNLHFKVGKAVNDLNFPMQFEAVKPAIRADVSRRRTGEGRRDGHGDQAAHQIGSPAGGDPD